MNKTIQKEVEEIKALNERQLELQTSIREKLIGSELDNFKKYIGKCFKVLTEEYEGRESIEYYKVKDVIIDSIKLSYDNKPTCEFICKSILKDKYNRIIFSEDEVYLHNLVDEITEQEFNEKLEELIIEARSV